MKLMIVGTKGQEEGVFNNDTVGDYEVLTKEQLIERLKELTDEGFGYTILRLEELDK